VPPNVQTFLKQHEADELDHLKQFETMLGHQSRGREVLPTVPQQWPALAVLLFGYEALGLEFAKLLIGLRPDMASIVEDEETHVGFFERELRKILENDAVGAKQARVSANAGGGSYPHGRSLSSGRGAGCLPGRRAHHDANGHSAAVHRSGITGAERKGPSLMRQTWAMEGDREESEPALLSD